jgi:hypothetical protein
MVQKMGASRDERSALGDEAPLWGLSGLPLVRREGNPAARVNVQIIREFQRGQESGQRLCLMLAAECTRSCEIASQARVVSQVWWESQVA